MRIVVSSLVFFLTAMLVTTNPPGVAGTETSIPTQYKFDIYSSGEASASIYADSGADSTGDALATGQTQDTQCAVIDYDSAQTDGKTIFDGNQSALFATPSRGRSLFYAGTSCPTAAAAGSIKASAEMLQNVRTQHTMSHFWESIIAIFGILTQRQPERSSTLSTRFKRRSRTDVIAEILRVSVDGTRKTRIIQSANLNSRIIEVYLSQLENAKLLRKLRPAPSVFMTTPRGQLFLLLYLKMNKLLAD